MERRALRTFLAAARRGLGMGAPPRGQNIGAAGERGQAFPRVVLVRPALPLEQELARAAGLPPLGDDGLDLSGCVVRELRKDLASRRVCRAHAHRSAGGALAELQVVQLAIASIDGNQLVMRAAFDDASFVQHVNAVCVLHCAESVGNGEDRPILH